jgi:hypothetical protein
VTELVKTSYLGFVILVTGESFTILGRDGEVVVTVKSMPAARRVISQLRAAERAA